MKIVIYYSSSCRSTSVRLHSFSEHKLRYFWWSLRGFCLSIEIQRNYHSKVQKDRKKISLKYSMWLQWHKLNFMKPRECFVCAKNNLPLYLQKYWSATHVHKSFTTHVCCVQTCASPQYTCTRFSLEHHDTCVLCSRAGIVAWTLLIIFCK